MDAHLVPKLPAQPRTHDWVKWDERRRAWEEYNAADVYEQLVMAELAEPHPEALAVPDLSAADIRRQKAIDRAARTVARVHQRLRGCSTTRPNVGPLGPKE